LDFCKDVGAISLTLYIKDDSNVATGVTLVPLADSFSEFVNGTLFRIPVLYCPIEHMGEHGTPADLDDYLVGGGSIDVVGKNELTIICEAIRFSNRPVVEECLKLGANLSGALHLAASSSQTELAKILVNAGADVNEKNKYGRRPIDKVAGTEVPGEMGARNREMRALLIELGAVSKEE
jgi:hypothetical protein